MAAKSLEFKNQDDSRPIKLFFQDEARFGRIDNISSCWVPPGCRAVVGKQIIREYTYLYGAFCPETGESFSLILPYANGQCMDMFLTEFSKYFSSYRVVMGLDNAAWHGKTTGGIDNIVPLFQPAHAPELNPAENMWHFIRESGDFKNRTFHSMEEVESHLCDTVQRLLADKEKVKSITAYPWIRKAVKDIMIAV